jgi:hypothetical protein
MTEESGDDGAIRGDVLARLNELIRLGQDDDSVLPGIRQFFDEHPDVWKKLSDIGYAADLALARLAAKNNTVLTEAYMRRLAEMKSELVPPDALPLEKLLVASVCSCFLAAGEAQITATENLERSPGRADFLSRRLDRAVKRYQAAIKTLALVKKLLLQPRSPVEIATQFGHQNERRRSRVRTPGPVESGTPILN